MSLTSAAGVTVNSDAAGPEVVALLAPLASPAFCQVAPPAPQALIAVSANTPTTTPSTRKRGRLRADRRAVGVRQIGRAISTPSPSS